MTSSFDPSSLTLAKTYAATVVSDMKTIIMRSSQVTATTLQVTEFVEVTQSARRRRDTESKAKAVIAGEATVPLASTVEDVQNDVQNTVSTATDDDFESLDVSSFASSEVRAAEVETTTTTTIQSTPASAMAISMGLLTYLLFCM